MTRPGCLISCAQYLKINASPAWIYGGTGYAFALNIAKDVCPSGPTAWPGDSCDARARNVGLAVETFNTDKRQPDFAQGQKRIWDQAQAALEAGHPCMAWEMDVPDWYVVYGCDSEGNYLFDQWGKEARKHYTRLGDSEIGVALVQATSTCPSADDQTVVREAIRFALDNSQGKGSQADWHTGLGGYDTWIAALTDEEALATNKIIGFGMGYNAACWKETRDYAVAFLREAKQRLDTRTLDPLFDEAIGHYATAAANLEGVAKLYPFSKGDDDASQARIMDAARRGKAVEQLKAARQAEVKGLAALARIGEQLAK